MSVEQHDRRRWFIGERQALLLRAANAFRPPR
jgi:hypothetical protein